MDTLCCNAFAAVRWVFGVTYEKNNNVCFSALSSSCSQLEKRCGLSPSFKYPDRHVTFDTGLGSHNKLE